MKKSILFVLSVFVLIAFLAIGTKTLKADEDVDESYIVYSVNQPTFAAKGSHTTISAWGERAVYKEKLHLDGLVVRYATDSTIDNSAMGFILGSKVQDYFGEPNTLSFTSWTGGVYGTQTRLFAGANHDCNGQSVTYTDAACTAKSFIANEHIVSNTVNGNTGTQITFKYLADSDCYELTYLAIGATLEHQEQVFWGNNPNYDADNDTIKLYVPAEKFNFLDENGNCYVIFAAFNTAYNMIFDVEDDAIRAYNGEQKEVGAPDESYLNVGGATAPTFTETATTSKLGGWGDRVAYKEAVHLDGLTAKIATNVPGDGNQCFGFTLGNNVYTYFDSSVFAFTAWKGLFTQTRVTVGANHDYNAAPVAYTNPECTEQGFIADGDIVVNHVENQGFAVTFKHLADKACYAVTISAVDLALNACGEVVWGNNPNYDAEKLSTTVYLKDETLASILDENGNCYIAFAGMNSGGDAFNINFSVEDDIIRSKAGAVKIAENKLNAFKEAVKDVDKASKEIMGKGVNVKLEAWGQRVAVAHPVTLDGLTVKLATNSVGDGNQCFGIALGANVWAYFDASPFAVTAWKGLFTQTRVTTGANHDYNAASVAYTNPECTEQGFIADGDIVINHVENQGLAISFKHLADKACYAVTISAVDLNLKACGDVVWGNNPNYDAEKLSTTVYVKDDTLAGILDENGKCYVAFCGLNSSTGNPGALNMNIVAYENDKVVSPLDYSAISIAPIEMNDFEAGLAVVNAYYDVVVAIDNLRARDIVTYKAALKAEAIKLQDNDYMSYFFAATILDKVAEINEKLDQFDLATDVTKFDLKGIKDDIDNYNETVNEVIDCLNEDNVKLFKDNGAQLQYRYDLDGLKVWLASYEKRVNDLDVNSPTIGAEVIEVKALRNTLNEAKVEALKAADKEEFNGRLSTIDADLALKEQASEGNIKEVFLTAFEELLTDNTASSYEGLTRAKAAMDRCVTDGKINSNDGEIYTRYMADVDKFYGYGKAFVKTAIANINAALDGEIKTLNEFNAIREAAEEFDNMYLDNNDAEYATIIADVAAVRARIEENSWYYINAVDLTKCEQTEAGISFSHIPVFPSRINYNKKLNLRDGVKVELQFDSIAFFNGDQKEDGSNKGANNLCINFLGEAGSYKSMTPGLNIIIWLFAVESNVQIVNAKDQAIASCTINTPIEGGKLVIEVTHGLYDDFVLGESYNAYVITINGNDIVLSDELVASNSLTFPDECYFSFGSFADYREDENAFTLLSVNGVKLGKKDAPIEPIDPPVGPVDPIVEPDTPKPVKLGCKKRSALLLIEGLSLLSLVLLVLRKRD